MKSYLLVFLVLTLALAQDFNLNYEKVTHNTDPEAKCLDGSPAALYVNEGSSP